MKKGAILLSTLCVIALAPRISHAEESQPKSRFGMSTIAYLNSGLQEFDDPDYSASASLWFTPSYKLSDSFKLGGLFIFDQALTGEQDTTAEDGIVSLRYKGWELNPFLKLSVGGSVLLPISKSSREQDSLITGLSAGPRLSLSLDRLHIPVSMYYDVSAGRRFYQYPASTSGNSNFEYAILQIANLEIDFTDKLAFSSSYFGTTGVTYARNVSNSFSTFQELDFQVTKAFGVGAGLSNGGNFLKPNGIDSNFAFFDSRSSSVYGSVSYTF